MLRRCFCTAPEYIDAADEDILFVFEQTNRLLNPNGIGHLAQENISVLVATLLRQLVSTADSGSPGPDCSEGP